MNILRRIEDLRGWLGLHSREKAVRGKTKEIMEESPSMGRFVLISRKKREAFKLYARDRGKERFLPIEIGIWRENWS